ncbi:MAG: hypothetical protein ACRDE7_14970, partial [Sphingobacterium sp.]
DAITVKTVNKTEIAGIEPIFSIIPGFDEMVKKSDNEYVFTVKPNYKDAHLLHFQNFFDSIRNGKENIAPVEFGVAASSAALMSFESQIKSQII